MFEGWNTISITLLLNFHKVEKILPERHLSRNAEGMI